MSNEEETVRIKKRLCLAAAFLILCATASVPAAPAGTKRRPPRARRPAAKAAQGAKFKPVCVSPNYPTPAPSASPAIDSQCGLTGSGAGAEGVQDSVKNNFCATGQPKAVTIADLTGLQAKVEKNSKINFGNLNRPPRTKGPTTNRALLKNIGGGKLNLGEGDVVTITAYVLKARQEGPESVNCGKNAPANASSYDIHISLVGSPDETQECAGVVAEMSPHHRPDSWTHANVGRVSRAKLQVRVTGQLFFDSSHFPCSGGKAVPGNPLRVSLWEIHPVYKFEVCTAAAGCDGGGGTWAPLDEWVKGQ